METNLVEDLQEKMAASIFAQFLQAFKCIHN
jgi:hypothetical protein